MNSNPFHMYMYVTAGIYLAKRATHEKVTLVEFSFMINKNSHTLLCFYFPLNAFSMYWFVDEEEEEVSNHGELAHKAEADGKTCSM